MTKLLEEIVKDLDNVATPIKASFGKPVKRTDEVVCKMNDDHKKLWFLRRQTEMERDRLDLRIRQLMLESRDMPEPSPAAEDARDQYIRLEHKYQVIDTLLSASLGYEFPSFRKVTRSLTIREDGTIVTEKPSLNPLAELLGMDATDFSVHG